jgi:hypothetical protein
LVKQLIAESPLFIGKPATTRKIGLTARMARFILH